MIRIRHATWHVIGWSLVLLGCAGAPHVMQRGDAPASPQPDEVSTPSSRALYELLDGSPGPQPAAWAHPARLVDEACVHARSVMALEAAPIPETPRARPSDDISPWLLADLAVWSALRVASLHTLPSPAVERVGAEAQLLARTQRRVRARELHLYVSNLGEHHHIVLYDENGYMRPEGLLRLREALRDQRAGVGLVPTPRLAAMLYLVGQHYDQPIHIISGYRIAGLHASRGSRHGTAAAVDIRVPGVSAQALTAHLERSFRPVGLGFYTQTGFVHLDDRDISYSWIDSSRPGRASRMRGRAFGNALQPSGDPTRSTPHLSERYLYQPPRP